ncbi:MAG: hypothetical protein ACK46Q_13675, partial [Hyphomonas sp.]
MTRQTDPTADLAFACRLADAARAAIAPHFRNLAAVDGKPEDAGGLQGFDPVTEADRAAVLDRGEGGVLDALLRLYLAAFAATRTADRDQTATLAQRRRAIFRAEPELAAARMTASSRFQLRLTDL